MRIIGYAWMQSRTRDHYAVAEVWQDASEELSFHPLRPDYLSVADAARVAADLQLDLEGT